MRELAPAKINPCLYLGALRADGRHELLSVMQSIELCDELRMEDAAADEVICPGVPGPNLAAAALAGFRELSGWDGPGQRIEIRKRIPVAAGMGGGSADAAAALRLLARRSGLPIPAALPARLGADVPGQIEPGRVLARGAGERIERLPDPAPYGILVLPSEGALATADVYRRADELGLPRTSLEGLDTARLHNDLEPAAISLLPSIVAELERAREAGAHTALLSGSGPTVLGLFERPDEAEAAARRIGTAALFARPVRHNSAS